VIRSAAEFPRASANLSSVSALSNTAGGSDRLDRPAATNAWPDGNSCRARQVLPIDPFRTNDDCACQDE
jgi:hypothetical protein